MPPHPLANFKIQKYYQNESKLNGIYSKNNSLKRKDGAYVINLDEYKLTGSHCIALYVDYKSVTYFDSLGVKYIPKEI